MRRLLLLIALLSGLAVALRRATASSSGSSATWTPAPAASSAPAPTAAPAPAPPLPETETAPDGSPVVHDHRGHADGDDALPPAATPMEIAGAVAREHAQHSDAPKA